MYDYRVKIVRVIDGDTVDVDIDLGFGIIIAKERVRVMGKRSLVLPQRNALKNYSVKNVYYILKSVKKARI